jgi:ubiquinone biosynthesis protein
MGRFERSRRALHVTRVARRSGLLRVLRELGVVGRRPATREGAQEFRRALEELGTTYIKLGQLLSSRPDLLPDVYVEELGKLVDDVPPVPFGEIKRVVDEDLPADTFARIEQQPLATASIAQIHPALLKSGRDVIIKVRRPGVVEQVAVDLNLLRSTAELLERRSERAQLLQARALADELEVHLRAELDLVEEANNTELIASLLEEREDLVVPRVIRPYVTERVLVLERIEGKKLDADHGLAPDRAKELARHFFSAYVEQVTAEGIYHADPHRGNVLLTTDGRLALVDFGLLGRLDDDTRRNLALLLLAVVQNRADDVADLILGLSRTSLSTDEPGFLQDLRRKLPRYHGRPLSGIRAGEALADLQRISFEYGIALPPSFALVGKTLAQADSIARVLDPDLDPIALLEQDSLEVMLREAERRLEPNEFFAWLFTQLEPISRLPREFGQLVDKLGTGTFKVGVTPSNLEETEHALRSVANRVGAAIIVVGLLLSAAILARIHDLRWEAFAGFVVAAVLGLYMVWKIIRTPGEL